MEFNKTYILENNRVLLRPLEGNDFDYLKHFPINEPNLWQYSSTPPNTPEKLKDYINLALTERNNQKQYAFIVFDKLKNAYAGSTRFYNINLHHKHCSLGYTWYGKDFQGTGLNKNCKFLLLQFAFETLAIERVQFDADNTNERSITAMKSIGCTVEGVLRNHQTMWHGKRRDTIVLSILKEEWFTTVKPTLLNKI